MCYYLDSGSVGGSLELGSGVLGLRSGGVALEEGVGWVGGGTERRVTVVDWWVAMEVGQEAVVGCRMPGWAKVVDVIEKLKVSELEVAPNRGGRRLWFKGGMRRVTWADAGLCSSSAVWSSRRAGKWRYMRD